MEVDDFVGDGERVLDIVVVVGGGEVEADDVVRVVVGR